VHGFVAFDRLWVNLNCLNVSPCLYPCSRETMLYAWFRCASAWPGGGPSTVYCHSRATGRIRRLFNLASASGSHLCLECRRRESCAVVAAGLRVYKAMPTLHNGDTQLSGANRREFRKEGRLRCDLRSLVLLQSGMITLLKNLNLP